MRARDLFERYAGPAPVEAPPKPDVKPGTPERPAPSKHPNPFRRRQSPGIKPGPMPKPKACAEALFNRDRAIKFGRAEPLPDFNFGKPSQDNRPSAKPGASVEKAAGAAKAVRAKETSPTPKAREMFLGMKNGRTSRP